MHFLQIIVIKHQLPEEHISGYLSGLFFLLLPLCSIFI